MRLLIALLIGFSIGLLVGISDAPAGASIGDGVTACAWCDEVMLPCERVPLHEDCHGAWSQWVSSPSDLRGLAGHDSSTDWRGESLPPVGGR